MAKDKNSDKNINLETYKDSTGVSLNDMNIGLWLSENRQKFLKILTIFLIVVCAALFIYSSYNYIIYFLAGDPNQQWSEDSSVFSPRKVTENLEVSPLQVFASGENHDLAVKLKNPNEKFMANFEYCFSQSDQDISCGNAFILPKEEKYLLILGQAIGGSVSELSFSISNIFWQRIDSHKIPDWDSFSFDRLNLLISGVSFTPGDNSGLSGKVKLNALEFSVKNQTAYGYYEVPLNILLFNGSNLIGVNSYLIPNFMSGEQREIRINWAGNLNGVNRIEIAPNLNIMNDNVYLKYQGANP